MRERWIQSSGGVRLQVLEHGDQGVPLLFVPGTPGPAADFLPDMEALAPLRTLAVSLRGASPSDRPDTGYRLEDFAADIAAAAEGLERVSLFGFSIAVPYVLAYAAAHPERVAGLILADYPARFTALPPEWAERIIAQAPPEFFPPHVVRGVQRDSANVELWDVMECLDCPVLILRAGQKSRLSDADMARFSASWPQAEVVKFDNSGHDVRRPDRGRFQDVLRRFQERL
jgi:pimeloyl-ACP methyl ester carboxylesterase